MQTTIKNDLKLLAEDLQQYFSGSDGKDSQVLQCTLKGGTLLVTCEHLPGIDLKSEQVFQDLEKIIRQRLSPENQSSLPENTEKVGICLQYKDHKHPYAYHSFFTTAVNNDLGEPFTVQPYQFPFAVSENSQSHEHYLTAPDLSEPDLVEKIFNNHDQSNDDDLSENIDLSQSISRSVSDNYQIIANSLLDPNDFQLEVEPEGEFVETENAQTSEDIDNPFDVQELDLILPEDELPPISPYESLGVSNTSANTDVNRAVFTSQIPTQGFSQDNNHINHSIQADIADQGESENSINSDDQPSDSLPIFSPLFLLGTVCSVLFGVGTFYLLSRPCVIGECQVITQAEDLAKQATTTWQKTPNIQNTATAATKLSEAVDQLETIPFWSLQRGKAGELATTYQTQADHFASLKTALEKANQAGNLSQKPPHPASTWQKIQTLWQEAIALLEGIPQDSETYKIAQQKLPAYRQNLAAVKNRFTQENLGEQKLKAAEKLAQLATTKEAIAQFPSSWEEIAGYWQQAIKQLNAVLASTVAHEQAQKLLPEYEAKLKAAEERKNLEISGVENYEQAVSASSQAKVFQEKNAWNEAVEYWQKAVEAAQKIPKESTSYTKIQPVLNSYISALGEAQAKQREMIRLTAANESLEKICGSNPLVCNYSVTTDLITVKLNPEYVKDLKQNANNQRRRSQLERRLKNLQVALEKVSNEASIPLEVYDPEGLKIGTNNP
jgi:hypothetical protein